ncbi:MAG: hypothetical protein HYS12_18160 [Planctomycetes bacterium]|nr:hypothetical protein [Planctomycetota bacterium]
MASEPHAVPESPHGHDGHGAVEMPRPTIAPLVVSLGMALLATGVAFGLSFLIAGIVLLACGLALWSGQLLPGRGHIHEPIVEPEQRPKVVTAAPGTVEHLQEGKVGYRFRLPLEVHPVSAGVKGGIVGGLLMIVPALAWGVFSGHGIWYPVNLLSGMVLPGIGKMEVAELEQFNFGMLIAGVLIHVTTSVIMGLMYGVLLPTLPDIPQSMAWAALLAPILWTAASYFLLSLAQLELPKGAWPWFILSQFVYGLVMAVAVVGQTGHHRPVVSGILGGLLGGALMTLPAILWGLTHGTVWYPVNLLAAMVVPGASELTQFHADWFAIACLMHAILSAGFGVAYALLAPKLRPIPAPLAWGGLLFPLFWTGMSYSLMGVVNPVFQDHVDWPWFIVSQFVFGMAAAIVVVRSEKVYIQPKGKGPDRVADFVTG